MRIQWYGQSAFALTGEQRSVFIDPFADMSPLAGRGIQFEYPAIENVSADVLLVTHEHLDHNGVGAIGGDPQTLRSTAGRHESPVGEVVGVASEHDPVAGTERGPNTIFVFELDGVRGRPRPNDRCRAGVRDRRARAAPMGRADALPHAEDRLPPDGRRVPRTVRRRRPSRLRPDRRDRRVAGWIGSARGRPGRA